MGKLLVAGDGAQLVVRPPSSPQPSVRRSPDRPSLGDMLRSRRREAPVRDFAVSEDVLQSWQRCLAYGLDPSAITVSSLDARDRASRLVTTAHQVLDQRQAELARSSTCIFLTDAEGVVVAQWSGNEDLHDELDRLGIRPGAVVAECTVGTTSAVTLVSRRPVIVRGPEHFATQFGEMTSAGNVIMHPVSRRVIGSLHLTCAYADDSPLALTWACELVTEIQRVLADSSSRVERLLMEHFLRENRDARHPVVALNEQSIVKNAAAAQLLDAVDQARLWEYATHAMATAPSVSQPFTLGAGMTLRVHCSPVNDGNRTVGAIVRLRRVVEAVIPDRTLQEADNVLVGLVGHGPKWVTMSRRIAMAGHASIALVGERGTGKTSIARALAGGAPEGEIDCSEVGVAGAETWFSELHRLLDSQPAHLIIRHVDVLALGDCRTLVSELGRLGRTTRVLATSNKSPGADEACDVLLDALGAVVPVPALRERTEDIPDLVAAITRRHDRGRSNQRDVRWMPEALQALARIEWPGNIASLEAVVIQALGHISTEYVGVGDIPSHLVVRASRRRLAGLERAEANAILQAVQEAGGNKHAAAEELGIARSTLYRKIRALGIDPCPAAF